MPLVLQRLAEILRYIIGSVRLLTKQEVRSQEPGVRMTKQKLKSRAFRVTRKKPNLRTPSTNFDF
ncbi:MAG: hypothetical protein CLLPBCKN_008218 [Chroococcidiopsis cubana SAG 39.79]|nr:hypothetical protein [Chroococcidiopsis cubana SAG 39.79]